MSLLVIKDPDGSIGVELEGRDYKIGSTEDCEIKLTIKNELTASVKFIYFLDSGRMSFKLQDPVNVTVKGKENEDLSGYILQSEDVLTFADTQIVTYYIPEGDLVFTPFGI